MPTTIPSATSRFVDDHATDPSQGFADAVLSAGDWDTVADARTRTLDAREGFEKMAEHAEPEFAPIVHAYLELHKRHADTLTRILADAGYHVEGNGSVMGTVNRLVVATRAFFDEIDADVLAQIHSGEEHVVAAYKTALAARLPAAVHDSVSRLLSELNELLADTKPLD